MRTSTQIDPNQRSRRFYFLRSRGLSLVGALLFTSLASLGLGDSSWSETRSSTNWGGHTYAGVGFTKAYTNDDGVVNDPKNDPRDNGIDPGYDKAVARCEAKILTSDKVLVEVTNGYPSYTCRFWTEIRNSGCRPVQRKTPVIKPPPELTVKKVNPPGSLLLQPGARIMESFTVHVEQSARQGGTYRFTIDNMFTEVKKEDCGCRGPKTGPGPCRAKTECRISRASNIHRGRSSWDGPGSRT